MPGGLRVERDPRFWTWVAQHPAAQGALMGLSPQDVGAFVVNPRVLPVASDNGGYLFGALDALGRAFELHALYRPEGWGREAHGALREALAGIFEGADLILALEREDDPRSRAPRTFGFVPMGEFAPSPIGPARNWYLTRKAWEGSPARQRTLRCPALF